MRSGELFEIGAGQMLRGAHANRAVIELLGVFLRIIDQLEERFGRKFRVDNDDIGKRGEQTDRCKVLLWIVTEFLEQSFVCSQRPGSTHHQRITVRRGVRGGCRTGVASRAGAIFDHEVLAERCCHPAKQDARDDVAGAAGGKRHIDLNRPVGIVGVRASISRH